MKICYDIKIKFKLFLCVALSFTKTLTEHSNKCGIKIQNLVSEIYYNVDLDLRVNNFPLWSILFGKLCVTLCDSALTATSPLVSGNSLSAYVSHCVDKRSFFRNIFLLLDFKSWLLLSLKLASGVFFVLSCNDIFFKAKVVCYCQLRNY